MFVTSKKDFARVPAAADASAAQDIPGGLVMNSWVSEESRPKTDTLRQNTNRTVEFDFRTLGDGRSASARYANNSNYRNDSLIRKESR